MIAADIAHTDKSLAAVAETAAKPAEALWLLLAAPLEPAAFNRALAEREAASVSSSLRVRA